MPAPTTNPIIWGDDATFTSGDRIGQPVKNAGLTTGEAAQGLVPGASLKGDDLNQTLNNLANWVEFFRTEHAQFGDQSDGDVTIVGTVTLSRDMYYGALIVPTGTVIESNGFRIFADTADVQDGGVIRNNGEAGTNGSPTDGGAGAPAGTLAAGLDGGDGGSNGPGTAGGTTPEGSVGGGGGAGGAANDGTGTAGAGGTATPLSTGDVARSSHVAMGYWPNASPLRGGAGGGGGGGGDNGDGGKGGGGGGLVVIWARELTVDGVIEANGGSGANADTDGDANGNGGGGGGGGGGVFLCYRQRFGSGTVQAAGGGGGTGALVGDTGIAGSAGTVREFIV